MICAALFSPADDHDGSGQADVAWVAQLNRAVVIR
jgi:hypothetical protein